MAIGNKLDEQPNGSTTIGHWIAVAHPYRPVAPVVSPADGLGDDPRNSSGAPSSLARPELTVVIPAFNEEYRLPVVIEALRVSVSASTTEIIVVDDGSSDDTFQVAKAALDWAPLASVLRHEKNRGKGAAVRTGVAAARAKIVGFLDADNATSLDTVNEMLPLVSNQLGTCGAAFGSRHAPGSVVTGSPLIRGLMGRVFNHIVKFGAGTDIGDTQCGAKVFSSAAARLAFYATSVDGFAFDVEILRRLIDLGFDVIEHPVDWHHVPGTKVQPLTPLKMFIDIAKLRFFPSKLMFPARPMSWSDELAKHCDVVTGTARTGSAGWVIDVADHLTAGAFLGDGNKRSSGRNASDVPVKLRAWDYMLSTGPES